MSGKGKKRVRGIREGSGLDLGKTGERRMRGKWGKEMGLAEEKSERRMRENEGRRWASLGKKGERRREK